MSTHLSCSSHKHLRKLYKMSLLCMLLSWSTLSKSQSLNIKWKQWIIWWVISQMHLKRRFYSLNWKSMKMLSRDRIQMQYRKSYRSNRESKQQTCVMIVLVERYCITCIFSLSTSCNDIYMYTRKTFLDSSIIDSDLDLFSLTNYLVRMMQAVLRHSSLI